VPAPPVSIARGAGKAGRGARRLLGLATKRRRILPSGLLIGAQRAGTTSLFNALARHPDVARPAVKEIHFFDDEFWRGVDWYRSFFPLSARREWARRRGRDLVAIDATPYYLLHPAVPERVAATLPEARLVVLLRDPVARAYSHYQMMRRKKIERLSFPDAIAAEEKRLAGKEKRLLANPRRRSFQHLHHSYVARGLYADQLERWLAHFPRSSLLVVFAEEFFARPQEIYSKALAHLGLVPWEASDFPNLNPAQYPEIDAETRARLAARFAEPNERLSRLLGRALPWDGVEAPGGVGKRAAPKGVPGL
jgi:lipopolysaccharide transport system ATP-binding protein